MQLQMMPVRLDELAERLLVPSSGPGQRVRSHVARFPFGTSQGSHRYRSRAGHKLGAPMPPSFPASRHLTPVTVTARAGAWPAGSGRNSGMRKVIEYTLVSADGAFDDPANLGFMQYQDERAG